MNFRSLAFAISALAALSSHALAQDADAGKLSYNKCKPCHQVGEGARNLVGPELNGVIGRKAGSIEGFNYSDANKDSGITWDEANFKEYIANPRAKVPGTKMAFAGIKNETEVNNLLAYLKTFDADGKTK